MVARIGGDEFAILVDTDVQGMKIIADRIHDNLAKASLTTSIGIAEFDPKNCKDVLRAAARYMYKAKDKNKKVKRSSKKKPKRGFTYVRRQKKRRSVWTERERKAFLASLGRKR